MEFTDYQKASLKHLNTCKVMLDSMTLLASNASAEINIVNKKQAILHNLFYHSGYTLECIINYAILKHYKWKAGKAVGDTLPDHSFSKKSGIAFYRDTKTQTGGVYAFNFQGHDFQRNIQVLTKALPASKIPLLDRSVRIDADLTKLLKAWQVEVRYHPSDTMYSNITLTQSTVERFVNLTNNIYNELMKLVG